MAITIRVASMESLILFLHSFLPFVSFILAGSFMAHVLEVGGQLVCIIMPLVESRLRFCSVVLTALEYV
ncbi:hypothetical protein TRIATDRAFT_259608 [Trichoderma atroviride IMI 206040]|uniref:Uncharacterized protein n=1 Tax=Hypocrea atroviridis (strain ATCC 20476 / IMI 206040) TaxID=452589 RepID=G9P489_HYPAI|nr:uncharacterized protein TRIATDRAFT_302277 [Trichoderma atroviride IMI 206040]EHK41932.1 hypothetical protein TRIATDRAFT_259608 [Trichoderma atroviride IMI 206040]